MNVIIIGAGAAGLMAAKKLSGDGIKVCVLEARDRIGGRIHTLYDADRSTYMEAGAEFIHGNLEETFKILKEAGLKKRETQGEFWQVTNGKWHQDNDFFANAEQVIKQMRQLKEDISIADFLKTHFAGEKYSGLVKSLTSYVEGYYSGETTRTSSKAFLDEWMSEDDQQYRPIGGYGKMIQYLADSSVKAGATILLSTVAKQVKWAAGHAEVTDNTGHLHKADKLIVTVPLGIWTAEETAEAAIQFTPLLTEKSVAAKQMGFGAVMKILLDFKDPFWEEEAILKHTTTNTGNLNMVISDEPVSTWWTLLPEKTTLLTGWLTGPKASRIKSEANEEVLGKSLKSLSAIFGLSADLLKEKLQSWKIFNWTTDPFTLGSYSYSTLDTFHARKTMIAPVENTLFFCGEALYDGPEMGTVEAALISGLEVATSVLKCV